jgi:hypothetical protein
MDSNWPEWVNDFVFLLKLKSKKNLREPDMKSAQEASPQPTHHMEALVNHIPQ